MVNVYKAYKNYMKFSEHIVVANEESPFQVHQK